MSQPTPYTPTTDFSQQEANNASGRSTVNTAALDAEFAAIDTTLDQTLANLQLIQRDDGRLKDVTVEVHTLSPEVLNLIGGYNLRGAWLSNTEYLVNDVVTQDTYLYACKTSHNSGSVFSDANWLIFGFSGSNDAAQAAAQAAVSANNAHNSEVAAAASASAASSSATTASNAATSASGSATSASGSSSAASTSATNAANSASDAASSAASISVPGGKAMVLKDSASVGYLEMPAGTTAQRPGSPVAGYTRFNTDTGANETWNGSAWFLSGNVTQTGTETLTNKTLTDSKHNSIQIGLSATSSQNFIISTPAVPDGTMTIKRENGTHVLDIDVNGVIKQPGLPLGMAQLTTGNYAASGTAAKVVLTNTINNNISFTSGGYTITVSGVYQLSCGVGFDAVSDAQVALIYKNGVSFDAFGGPPATGFQNRVRGSRLYSFTAGDLIELWHQRGGTPCNVITGTTTYLELVLVKGA
jgi:hypothetical protein